jgi:hypothetical protein
MDDSVEFSTAESVYLAKQAFQYRLLLKIQYRLKDHLILRPILDTPTNPARIKIRPEYDSRRHQFLCNGKNIEIGALKICGLCRSLVSFCREEGERIRRWEWESKLHHTIYYNYCSAAPPLPLHRIWVTANYTIRGHTYTQNLGNLG